MHALDQILEHEDIAVVHRQDGAVKQHPGIHIAAGEIEAHPVAVARQDGFPQQLLQTALPLGQTLQTGPAHFLLALHQPLIDRLVEHAHLGGVQPLEVVFFRGAVFKEGADLLFTAVLSGAGENGVQLGPVQKAGADRGAQLGHKAVLNECAYTLGGAAPQLIAEHDGDLLRHIHRMEQPIQSEQKPVFRILYAAIQIVIFGQLCLRGGVKLFPDPLAQVHGGFPHRQPQRPEQLVIFIQHVQRGAAPKQIGVIKAAGQQRSGLAVSPVKSQTIDLGVVFAPASAGHAVQPAQSRAGGEQVLAVGREPLGDPGAGQACASGKGARGDGGDRRGQAQLRQCAAAGKSLGFHFFQTLRKFKFRYGGVRKGSLTDPDDALRHCGGLFLLFGGICQNEVVVNSEIHVQFLHPISVKDRFTFDFPAYFTYWSAEKSIRERLPGDTD